MRNKKGKLTIIIGMAIIIIVIAVLASVSFMFLKLPGQEVKETYKYQNLSLLNSKYNVGSTYNIGKVSSKYYVAEIHIYPKQYFNQSYMRQHPDDWFKIFIYAQNSTNRKELLPNGLTWKDHMINISSNLQSDNQLSYEGCAFKKDIIPAFGTKITGICDDGETFIVISSQAPQEEKARELMREVLDVMSS